MLRLLTLCLLAIPSAHAAQPYCALPPPPVTLAADQKPLPAQADAPPPRYPAPISVQGSSADVVSTSPLPEALRGLPFIQHVLSKGATVFHLGTSHGLHAIAAKHGDQFMIFQVLPDGQAAVSGAMTDLTPAQLSLLAGDKVTELAPDHGIRGFFVRSGPQFQVFYAAPDGERVIPGVLYDAGGKDITRQQVSGIPGAIPTIEVGNTTAAPAGQSAAAIPALPLVQKAAYGTVGPSDAPHLWMLIDAQCIFSVRAYQSLQPYVASGRVQLSVIPLSVLDYEDQGQSTKSALALLSKPADQLVTAWRAGSVAGETSADAPEKLRANMAIAQSIGLSGTPTFVWRKPDGSEGRVDGMPSNFEALIASIGG